MYLVKSSSNEVYITVEPILHPGNEEERRERICWGWTSVKGEAVRFTTRYHAHAVAKRVRGRVVRVP
jgi:hypothetical protein